jgi:hypothetical protein
MDDKAQILHRGMWQIPYKAVNVLCSDGVRRTVNNLKPPDTFFSIPGQVQAHGKTLSGFIMSVGEDLIFSQYTYGKNGAVLPDLPAKDYPGLRE